MNGGPRHEVQTTDLPHRSKDGNGRALAPVVTRVDTDPSQAYAWQKESSVRHVQEPSAPYAGPSNQNNRQQWQGEDLEQPAPYANRNGNGTPDSQKDGRREYRNSGWRPQNGVGVTGAG